MCTKNRSIPHLNCQWAILLQPLFDSSWSLGQPQYHYSHCDCVNDWYLKKCASNGKL